MSSWFPLMRPRKRRIFGLWRRISRQRSYCACMLTQNSADVPKAAARRRAMPAEIPAFPLRTRDRVTRVTPRCWATADTGLPAKYSRSTNPGCGGLCILIKLLVIVLIINERHVLSFKLEGETPIPADLDRPMTFEPASQRVKLPTRSV